MIIAGMRLQIQVHVRTYQHVSKLIGLVHMDIDDMGLQVQVVVRKYLQYHKSGVYDLIWYGASDSRDARGFWHHGYLRSVL